MFDLIEKIAIAKFNNHSIYEFDKDEIEITIDAQSQIVHFTSKQGDKFTFNNDRVERIEMEFYTVEYINTISDILNEIGMTVTINQDEEDYYVLD